MNGEISCILYEDESMIRDYQAIQKTWFAKGQQRIIPTYGKHEGVKLVGFLNYETGEIYVEEHKKYDAEVFRCFLIHVLEHYPEGEIVMILDNAKRDRIKFPVFSIFQWNSHIHICNCAYGYSTGNFCIQEKLNQAP